MSLSKFEKGGENYSDNFWEGGDDYSDNFSIILGPC
jgi:hypothetical protein